MCPQKKPRNKKYVDESSTFISKAGLLEGIKSIHHYGLNEHDNELICQLQEWQPDVISDTTLKTLRDTLYTFYSTFTTPRVIAFINSPEFERFCVQLHKLGKYVTVNHITRHCNGYFPFIRIGRIGTA